MKAANWPWPAFALFTLAATVYGEPSSADSLAAYFQPFTTDQIALAPDGRHLAYPERAGRKVFLVIRDVDANSVKKIYLDDDEITLLSANGEAVPSRLTFLRWATADRVVFNLNGRNIWAIDADGGHQKSLADSHDFDPFPQIGKGGGAPGAPSGLGQAIDVLAMPLGEPYLYVDAVRERMIGKPGSVRIPPNPALFNSGLREMPMANAVAVRTVLKVDIRNGRTAGETDLIGGFNSTSRLISDQQGRARVALWRLNLETNIDYAPASNGRWGSLDKFLAGESPLNFHRSPGDYFGHRSLPLGFDFNPDILYFASNVGRDTYGIYAIDLKSRRRTAFALENPSVDLVDALADASPENLVFDPWKRRLVGLRVTAAQRSTLWLDTDLAEVQAALNGLDPGKTWEVLDWDAARSRFLVLGSSNSDPGAYYLFDRGKNRLDEYFRRAPALAENMLSRCVGFGFDAPSGGPITGYLTLPRRSRLKAPPVVVLCHDGPWGRDLPGYDASVQALASMGFAVVQVNFRGSAGFGNQHLNALRAGFDTLALDDILATLDWVIGTQHVDKRLVAIMGRGYGGYLALRALQLHPDRFRCGIAIDAPADLAAWLNPGVGPSLAGDVRRDFLSKADLGALSPITHPELLTNPLMIVQSEQNPDIPAWQGRNLRSALIRLGRLPEYVQLSPNEASGLPDAQAALFRKIEEFFNLSIYNYAVKVGALVEKK